MHRFIGGLPILAQEPEPLKISKNVAYGLMAIAAIAWATSGTLTELSLDAGAEVLQITALSYVFSAAILLPVILLFDPKSLKIDTKDLVPFLVFSLVTGTFFSLAWFFCVEKTGVATAVILLYLYPSIVTIASVFLLKEKLTFQKSLALPITFAGAVLVAGAQDFAEGLTFDMVGVGLGIFAAAAGAVYYLWGKKFLDKYTANTVILYMTLLSIPGLFLISVTLMEPLKLFGQGLSGSAFLWIFLLGLIPGMIGFVISMFALGHIEASKASIVASIEPVAAVIIAYLVLSQKINTLQTVGVALVFIGVLLLRMTWRSAKPENPQELALDR